MLKQLWAIEEYKFWKGPAKSMWLPINIVSSDYDDLNETLEYIERNSPEKVFRIAKWSAIPKWGTAYRLPKEPDDDDGHGEIGVLERSNDFDRIEVFA